MTCPRCSGPQLAEPITDHKGTGNEWTCAHCGESRIEYAKLRYAPLTAAERAAITARAPQGRKRKVVAG